MAEIRAFSILSGGASSARMGGRARNSAPREDAEQKLREQIAANERLKADAEESARKLLTAEGAIGKLREDLAGSARDAAQAQAERRRAEELQERIAQEISAHGQTQIGLAVERSGREWLTAQLKAEREERVAIEARLEQAIAASASRPTPTKIEPPAYEMEVVGRDVNGRPQRIRLTPAKP